ncbi:hypothetical protein [Bdellovibrio sp. HCB2-146]|uniref:hypothetical protein n=1 Tax=Bdellovibrio sp. HCB2-146 TaxID=3394362 RepID=UPI0039BCFB11
MKNFILVLMLVISFGIHANASMSDTAKSVDKAALADLEREFQSFKGITMNQYLQLKKNHNPELLSAQRMMHQYIQSSIVQLVSNPGVATEEELQAEFHRRQQFFKSPVIFQTGLEIIAHELLKPVEEMKCSTVVTTLRFIALGVDGNGQETPGLDYVRNQLMLMHLYIAYVENKEKNSLPCQQEILDYTIQNPSLKNQYRPGCNQNSWDVSCHTDKGKFWDSETRLALMKIVRAYNDSDNFYFNGGGGRFRYGILGTGKGYSSSYETGTYLDAPTVKNRRPVLMIYQYQRPRPSGSLFDSQMQMSNFEGRDVSPSEVPKINSQQVFDEYRKLAEGFLR